MDKDAQKKPSFLLFKLLSLGFGLAVGLVLCEAAVRVYYFGADAFSYEKVNSFVPMGVSGLLTAADNSDVLYELKPNVDQYFKLKQFTTNDQGFRDQHYSVQKPGGTIRGLVLGDSYTMGSGVDIEHVYHSVVEQRLNEAQDGISYELINFGVGGYNLLNYKGVLEAKALQYNPDYIVIGYCAFNDFFLPPAKHYEGNYKVKIKKSSGKPFYSFYLGGLIDRALSSTTTKQMFDITQEEIAFVDKMFGIYSAWSNANNIPIIINVVAVLPDNGNLATIQALADKHGLPITNSYGKIPADELPDYTISKLDHHPNAKANQAYATSLLEFEPFQQVLESSRAALQEQ